MTLWLADQREAHASRSADDFADDFLPCVPALGTYRAAVADLAAEVGRCTGSGAECAEHVLTRRLHEHQFSAVLSATPDGRDAAIASLLFGVRNYQPSLGNSIGSVAALVRISMLAQIEAVWWGSTQAYQTDAEVLDSPDLVDLDDLDQAGRLAFRYRHQADTLLARAARSAQRRTLPGHAPRTAGLWLARARPQAIAWLNELAQEFERAAPAGTPPLWVTSLARSVRHQRHLKSLGYVALLPSAHCAGYAADIEMRWYRRFHAHRILRGLLLDRQRADEVNVIDEGQAWHVCLSPDIVQGPRRIPRPRAGS